MVLVGKVNRDIVAAINTHGPLAVGLSGEDAGLIEAEPPRPRARLRRRRDEREPGDRAAPARRGPHPGGVHHRCRRSRARPTTSTPTRWPAPWPGAGGREAHLPHRHRRAARATSPTRAASSPPADTAEIAELIADGVLSGGMIPKIAACLRRAARRRRRRPTCSTAACPTSLLLELFTDAGVGTMITTSSEELS